LQLPIRLDLPAACSSAAAEKSNESAIRCQAAPHGIEVAYVAVRGEQGNFDGYPLVRMSAAPEIEVPR